MHRFGGRGLYMMDEPEAALSPMRQMTFLTRMHWLTKAKCQFIIATHSPILMAYPNAAIIQLTAMACLRWIRGYRALLHHPAVPEPAGADAQGAAG